MLAIWRQKLSKEGGSLRGYNDCWPLLARFGRVHTKPGGDKIGRRRLDTHFEGFINLNSVTTEKITFMVLKLKTG
jgi:UDP-N-acetylglucosamine 1-carboxyvinyltransferase